MKRKNIKKYTFNEDIAIDVGIEEAMMFSNLYFWIEKNEGKEDHLHEGKYWMYCTVREFADKYPFWSEAQIKRILKNLKNKDYIETGEFNKWNPDRTKWYTITEKGLLVMRNDSRLVENNNS
jgi:acid phosphatase class B